MKNDNGKNNLGINTGEVISLTSFIIHNMRFPLILLIVLMHASLCDLSIHGGEPVKNTHLGRFFLVMFRDTIPNIAVPCFFIISGFLFFSNVQGFSKSTYAEKLRRRARTLLLPYIVWNFLGFVCFAIKHSIPSIWPRISEVEITWPFFLLGFVWNSSVSLAGVPKVPMDGPLWYVRDLMFMALISPIIYKVVKNRLWGGGVNLLLLVNYWLIADWDYYPFFSVQSLLFFVTGAYMGAHRNTVSSLIIRCYSKRVLLFIVIAYIAYAIIFTWMYPSNIYLQRLNILGGVPAFVILVALLTLKGLIIDKRLVRMVFFIYAFHGLFLGELSKFFYALSNKNDISLIMLTIFCFLICVLVCMCTFVIIKRTPKFIRLSLGC